MLLWHFVSVLVTEMCYTNKLALQVGIKNRFGHMSGDPELIAAAILLPKFRTTWTKDESTIKTGKTSWG